MINEEQEIRNEKLGQAYELTERYFFIDLSN